MSEKSFRFSHAITRAPSSSIVDGLRAEDTGTPDIEIFRQHHRDYVAALKSTGAQVTELPALDAYPDSVFVEDAALCLAEVAIVMRPGAPSRLGEAAEMAPTLQSLYDDVLTIAGPGFIEGGDILVTEREILIGTSARTDTAGVEDYKVIHTADGEEACANAIRFNDVVLLPAGFPKTADRLAQSGYNLRVIGNSEAAKVDGGMSCLSLRCSPKS
jgi:dimethylargininase